MPSTVRTAVASRSRNLDFAREGHIVPTLLQPRLWAEPCDLGAVLRRSATANSFTFGWRRRRNSAVVIMAGCWTEELTSSLVNRRRFKGGTPT